VGPRAWILAGSAAACGATLAIGALHLPAAKPLLLLLTGGSCPIGEELSPAARDDARALSVATVRGESRAPSRPALGLTLGVSTRAEGEAWGATRGFRCAPASGGLRCEGAAGEDVWLELDGTDHVVSVVATQRDLTPAAGTAAFAQREQELAELGTPWKRRDADLTRTLAQQLAEYRYEDYRVQVTATNTGGRVTLRTAWQDLEG